MEFVNEKFSNPSIFLELYKYKPVELTEMGQFYTQFFPEIKTKKILRTLYEKMQAKPKFKPYFFINYEIISTLSITSKIYIGVAFLPPIKINSYFLRPGADSTLYYSINYVSPNTEELRADFSATVLKKRMRVFNKPSSMFQYWHEDTPKLLAKAFKLDFERCKISRMIRTTIEREEIYNKLFEYYAYIKEEFSSIIVKSSYPHITWNDFTMYTQQKGIISKEISLSVLDRLFITVNVDLDVNDDDGNPDRELCRSEFLEIIVRIASAKYKDTGKAKFLADAVIEFLHDLTSIGKPQGIHESRVKNIWTLPIDELLRANKDGIKKVFWKYGGMKRYLTLKEAITLIVKECKYNIIENDIVKVYGYSKMTIINEAEKYGKYFL